MPGTRKRIPKERENEILGKIRAKYEESMSPYYAAARLWLDAIIDPLETRTWISMAIEAASHLAPEFADGVTFVSLATNLVAGEPQEVVDRALTDALS